MVAVVVLPPHPAVLCGMLWCFTCLPCPWAVQWGATVYAHRKARDDHVKLAVLVGGQALAADVTDDRLAIRIPNAPGKHWGVRF